jgi:transcriptional regulator with XRE-family HTH domain
MLGQRIKQYRLAKGFSLDELVAAMGGMVTKVALSKYERNIIKPSNKVLSSIAKALDIKILNLAVEPKIKVEFIAYRKGSGLSKRKQLSVESLVSTHLEDRVKIQDILFPSIKPSLPVKKYEISSLDDVENVSVELRKKWNLGLDPISNITSVLENNFVHVLSINSDKKFDGISAIAYTDKKQIKAAAVVSKKGIPGERQRLNLAHELGHVVLNVSPALDEEKVAFRFGGAFLAPAETIFKLVGKRRAHFQINELFIFKKILGLSIQATLFRLRDLDIITPSSFSSWYRFINTKGWKINEPNPMKEEKSQWFEKNILHAFSEGLISSNEAARLLGKDIDSQELSLIQKKEFLKLSLSDRNKILSEQADKFVQYYNSNSEWKEFGGDIIEY